MPGVSRWLRSSPTTSSGVRSGTSRKSSRAVAAPGRIVFAPASVWPVRMPHMVQVGPKMSSLASARPVMPCAHAPMRNSRRRPASSSSMPLSIWRSSVVSGARCDEKPSMVMIPFGETTVESACTSRQAGFGTMPPHLECKSVRAP